MYFNIKYAMLSIFLYGFNPVKTGDSKLNLYIRNTTEFRSVVFLVSYVIIKICLKNYGQKLLVDIL